MSDTKPVGLGDPCANCGGPLGIDLIGTDKGWAHYSKISCFEFLRSEVQRINLQIDELKAIDKARRCNAHQDAQPISDCLECMHRLNGELLAALTALADRVSVRFGEIIKYEPVAIGRYLDAAYEAISKARATGKRISENPIICRCNETSAVPGLHSQSCPVVAEKRNAAVMCPSCGMAYQPTGPRDVLCRECEGK